MQHKHQDDIQWNDLPQFEHPCYALTNILHEHSDPHTRIATLQTGSPDYLHFLGACPGDKKLESSLHKKFKKLRVLGEWFDDSPIIRDFIQSKCVTTKQNTLLLEALLEGGAVTLDKATNILSKDLAEMGREYMAYLIRRIEFNTPG